MPSLSPWNRSHQPLSAVCAHAPAQVTPHGKNPVPPPTLGSGIFVDVGNQSPTQAEEVESIMVKSP